ncbi:rhomboid family intramembrane serine protease [Sphingomonas jatrophae]|uniref:Membrane associated serine protease, rhomboid family n=1 Tax=Sphingomonas jatrophae TaxID=1166337 RepID=A0A1I6JMQ2_9SPHN|nr:rhomboid family intramembrane serine protease [Sphingomonas jatrophae]SFR80171.1 Membrane associated serine protease, rhomboid family [Sphingomonas jatrophae]
MKLPPARATVAIAGLTAVAYPISTLASPGLIALLAGLVPARLSGVEVPGAVPAWLTPLTATLLHGGVVHLAMNLLMLGFCGRLIEPAVGARGVVLLYVVGAYAAGAAQWAWSPFDMTPMVGASGAISAVLATYALLYGERRLTLRNAGLTRWANVAWLAAAWIGINLLVGVATRDSGMSVAVPAHIGGFVAGLLLTRPLLSWRFGRTRRH